MIEDFPSIPCPKKVIACVSLNCKSCVFLSSPLSLSELKVPVHSIGWSVPEDWHWLSRSGFQLGTARDEQIPVQWGISYQAMKLQSNLDSFLSIEGNWDVKGTVWALLLSLTLALASILEC